MTTFQEQIEEIKGYPSCAHISPQKLALMLEAMYNTLVSDGHPPLPIFLGTFNSGLDCDRPGVYNSVNLGRPANSLAGETYTLITNYDGSQEVRSNSVPGKAYYRRNKNEQWFPMGIE